MVKKSEKFLQIINQCYEKNNRAKALPPISEEELSINLNMLDDCIDCVADELCDYGFNDSDGEPNEYGLELEEVIGYLLEYRYKLAPDGDAVGRE